MVGKKLPYIRRIWAMVRWQITLPTQPRLHDLPVSQAVVVVVGFRRVFGGFRGSREFVCMAIRLVTFLGWLSWFFVTFLGWFSDLLKCLAKCDSQVIQFVTKHHPRSLGWSPNQPFNFGSRKFTIPKRSPAELPGVALFCVPSKKRGVFEQ